MEFPKRFYTGSGEGFWWAFISMTTVGYVFLCQMLKRFTFHKQQKTKVKKLSFVGCQGFQLKVNFNFLFVQQWLLQLTTIDMSSFERQAHTTKWAVWSKYNLFVCSCRYGDRSPRSVGARLFAMFWVLAGLVLASILMGSITNALTTVTFSVKSIKLYGTKVFETFTNSSWLFLQLAVNI